MSFEHRPPKWRESSFDCPRCGAFAKQDWYEMSGAAMASRCSACNQSCLWVEGSLFFPDAVGTVHTPIAK